MGYKNRKKKINLENIKISNIFVTMKINKALKAKNKLVKKANTEFSRISQNNVYKEGATPNYSAKDNLNKFLNTTNELIALKTKIHKANFAIYGKIFRMSELKNAISKLRSINTSVPVSYGQTVEHKYVIDIKQIEIDEMIEMYELEIEQIQEELEHHNHTKDI